MDHLFGEKVPPRHFKREALRRRQEAGEVASSENEKRDGSIQAVETAA